jgi:phosphatidate cytidylyltransferase
MFRLRLLTSLILIPLVIAAIYLSPTWVFEWVCLLLMLAAALEWSTLIGISQWFLRVIFLILVLAAMMLVAGAWAIHVYPWVTLIFWLFMTVAIYQYPGQRRFWLGSAQLWIIGILLFAIAWMALVEIRFRAFGSDLVLYLLLLVWAADIGAYTVGKLWGKHKLIPRVSPGKTIEGLAGGIGASLLVSIAAKWWIILPIDWFGWLAIALVTSVVSVIGDLLISIVKRHRGVKDSGHLLPGHGGLLDRLDSLLAAAPVFAIGLWLLQ